MAPITQESYSYDVYGKPSAASTIGNRYMFTGREYDAETGLYYYRARYYSAELGRFLQTDPVGYKAGINLYKYCSNNPINFVDPMGLDKQKWNMDKFHQSIGLDTTDKYFNSLVFLATYTNSVIENSPYLLVGIIATASAPPPFDIAAGALTFSGAMGLAIDAYKQAWIPIYSPEPQKGLYYKDAGTYYRNKR